MSHSFNWRPCLIAYLCLFAGLQVQESAGQTLSTADRTVIPGNPGETILKRDSQIRELATPEPSRSYAGQSDRQGWDKTLTTEQKKYLAGADEDRAKFADFLKQPDTGLFRLLPAVDYQTSLTVSADTPERSMPIRGGGAYYSFGKKTHIFGPWSDVHLKEKVFFTEVTSLSTGVFTALGDTPLESVTLESPGVDYLKNMTVPTLLSEATAHAKRNAAGFKEGEYYYRSAIRALPNITYVLRSVSYKRPDFLIAVPGTSMVLSSANVHQGGDIIVAFRIVREEAGGVLTILWKRLKKSSAPQLKRDKK